MSTTITAHQPCAQAREMYATLSREELYGPTWERDLATSSPLHCPDWCEGKHGHKEDLFYGRITKQESAVLHCRSLVDTDSFEVVLVEEETHPDSGSQTRLYFVLNGPDCTVDPEQHPTLDFLEVLARDLTAVVGGARSALDSIERGESL